MLKIAHRSGPVSYPEQTVKSAKEALSLKADYVEIDLRFSKDNKIICSHDDNLSRIFGIDKKTNEITLDEFCSLTHKADKAYHGHSFEDYIAANISPLLLHIKEGKEKIKDILLFLKQYEYLDKVIIGTSRIDDIEFIKENCPYVPVLAFMKNPSYIEKSAAAGADYIRLWQEDYTQENIERVRKTGAGLFVMVGNTEGYDVGETSDEFLAKILKDDVQGILINDVRKFNA